MSPLSDIKKAHTFLMNTAGCESEMAARLNYYNACHPLNIAALLQHIEALQAQVEALEADAQRSLEERIAMAVDQAPLERDALRYRWLRDRAPWTLISSNGITRLAARLAGSWEGDSQEKDDMDAAIDGAMASAAQEG